MKNEGKQETIDARESAGLSACADSAQPKGTPRACQHLGALSCNTAPHTYQGTKLIKPLRTAIDSLYLTYQGTIYPHVNDHLQQLKLIAGNKTSDSPAKAVIRILDHNFEVEPSGARNFAYVLRDNWFYLKISSSNATTLPLASVQISSELLTHQPLQSIRDDLWKILNVIGHVHQEEV